MTALTKIRPKAVKLNADGKATAGFEAIEIRLPDQAGATVRVGYFPRTAEDLPGWRAEATSGRIGVTTRSGAARERWHAIVDAVEALTNACVDLADRHQGSKGRWLRSAIAALNAWSEAFEKQAKKEQPIVINAKAKILNTKECKGLLEDFRRCYSTFRHSFIELGEKAEAIRDQEAYGEKCETFDQWIKAEGFGHSLIYDSMKAARLCRLMAPTLDPKKITLDCESHYRDIPADVTPREAKAIAVEIAKLAPADDKLTRQHVKAAVAKVRQPAETKQTTNSTNHTKGTTASAVELIDRAEREEKAAADADVGMLARGPATISMGQVKLEEQGFKIEGPSDGSHVNEERYRWNGQQSVYAASLHDVRNSLTKLYYQFSGRPNFRADFASLLSTLSVEVANDTLRLPAPSSTPAGRRAK